MAVSATGHICKCARLTPPPPPPPSIAIEILTRHEDCQSSQPSSQDLQPLKRRATGVGQFSLYGLDVRLYESQIARFNGGNKRGNLSSTLCTRLIVRYLFILYFSHE